MCRRKRCLCRETTVAVCAGRPVDAAASEEFWTTSINDTTGNEREQFTRHVRDFLNCIRSREKPISDLKGSHRVSTMCHLANLSMRLGRRLEWNADLQQIVGDASAGAMLVRPYRDPWNRELESLI